MIVTTAYLKALTALYAQDKPVFIISVSEGSVEASYRIGRHLAESNGGAIVVVEAPTMPPIPAMPYRANPVIKQVEAGPQQSGKEARRKRREQERNKKPFWKI